MLVIRTVLMLISRLSERGLIEMASMATATLPVGWCVCVCVYEGLRESNELFRSVRGSQYIPSQPTH